VTTLWTILAPFVAFVIIGVAVWVAVVLANLIRRYDYRRFEDKSALILAEQFPLPEVASSTAEARRKSLGPLIAKIHQRATTAQTSYHNAVVGSAACLVAAFLALALATFTLRLGYEWWPAQFLLNCIDVTAIIAVLGLFFYGRSVNRPWIACRAAAELLRQYQYFAVVLPSAVSAPSDDDLGTQFAIEARRLENAVERGSMTTIVARIEDFWSGRRARLIGSALAESDLTGDALLVYLDKRVRRQLGWFTDSKDRLEDISDRRTGVLLVLYLLTFALAVTKLVLFLCGGGQHDYVLPPLLVVTGMSAAMTAYYVNQNSRSLIHRYYTQQRFVQTWLSAFNRNWNFAGLPLKTFSADEKTAIRGEILRFEDLMVDELIDWIHITSHDKIELAP
jgi:hypothetical protein